MRRACVRGALVLLTTLGQPAATAATPVPLDARAIQDAVDAAAPGAVIDLPAGRIAGTLRVDKPVTVRGAGRDRTIFVSKGHRPALVVGGTPGRVVVQAITFTSRPDAPKGRGAGVLISGPGEVLLREVGLRRTIAGRCLNGAISLAPPLRLIMERVQIERHRCYMAGALVIGPGAEVDLVESLVEANEGELAGAILLNGGHLRVVGSVFRANRFLRGDDGHHLVVGRGDARSSLELVAVEMATDADRSILFEAGLTPEVRFRRMPWPEPTRPAFVTPAD